MTKKPLTVTIGMPAFNEEKEIGYLLKDLVDQIQTDYVVEKIIVNSDGSTDNTVNIVKSFKNNLVDIWDNPERKGMSTRVNEMFEKATSDCFVLLNADIRIHNKNTLNILIKPITEGIDLVGGNIVPKEPKGVFEKILYCGTLFKNSVMDSYNKGNNYHTCHGPIRAFSKNLYSNFRLKYSTGEDAYSYLYVKSRGFKYKFLKEAIAEYRLPTNLKDHLKQAHRFFNQNSLLGSDFGNETVKNEMKLPLKDFITKGALALIKNPIYILAYVLLTLGVFINNKVKTNVQLKDTWDMVKSSKVITR